MATASAKLRFPVVVRSPFLLLLLLIGPVRRAAAAPQPKIRAVNLGGWLVTEGWITPWLFEKIPNKDFLDGMQLQFTSVTTGKYLAAEKGGDNTIVADQTKNTSRRVTFKLWRVDENNFQLRVFNGRFWGLGGDGGNSVVATATNPGRYERFQIVRNSKDPNLVRIKAPNKQFLRVNSLTSVTADASGTRTWDSDDSTVFYMTLLKNPMGEFQLTNGYGPIKASSVLKEHWNTYIGEKDFSYLHDKGLNAVRIPVGWWITKDPAPWPFVTGSLRALDNAFDWADKHDLGVIVDLHAAPGAQNPDEHSGSRDGNVSWGFDNQSIQQTVEAIDFLASRYKKSRSLLGIELLNEPHVPGVPLDALRQYYREGYKAVRRHTRKAYVIMSIPLGKPVEKSAPAVLKWASGLQRTVVDVHCYNIFESNIKNSAKANIDYVFRNRAEQIKNLTRTNGPLVFVGEWSAAWNVRESKELGQYAAAQLEVFGQATFGWAFWTYETAKDPLWSLRWMIENHYMSIN